MTIERDAVWPGRPGVNQTGFAAFREKVFTDRDLQQRLRNVHESDAFIELAVQLGREAGLQFTAADVAAEMMRGRTAWMMSWIPLL